ncbi:MAG: endolytic transglycosylase MltG [Rhodospirillaceae bacterium]|nr:endolytic transglycosylase MltG [Rhodospirillaceae bacterium]
MVRGIKRLIALVLVLAVAAIGAGGYGWHLFVKEGPLAADKQLVIPRGAHLDQIADTLAEAGIIDSRFVFTTWVRILRTQGRLRSGEYRFAKRISAQAAMNQLISGRQIQHRLTVPEGLTTYQVLERVEKAEGLEGKLTESAGEGELLPDTYFYTLGETRNALVQRMKRAMQQVLDDAWAQRETDSVLKSKQDLLTLASIVEKETGDRAERAMVAGVFVNRLKRNMRLETDPTVIYGITEGKGALGRRLLRSDLEKPSPYNTYKIAGLPPGPIANPGRDSIMATVHPSKHNYIYFVADGTGGHVFSETLAEHNRNVAKWRQIRRERERQDKREN